MPQGPMRFFIRRKALLIRRKALLIGCSSSLHTLIIWDNNSMPNCVLFIDGENFLYKIKEVIKQENLFQNKTSLATIDLGKLFKEPLKGFDINRKIFYAADFIFIQKPRRNQEILSGSREN